MADNQDEYISQLIEKFRMAASSKSETTIRNYNKAIRCLESFAGTYSYSSAFPSVQILADWLLNMRIQGMSLKTVSHYFDIIAALYKETAGNGSVTTAETFGMLKEKIRSFPAQEETRPIDSRRLNKILSITKTASSLSATRSVAAGVMLYSLLHRGMPLLQAAKVKTEDVMGGGDEIQALIKQYSAPNRKYLFPLGQSGLTDRQLSSRVETAVKELLSFCGIPVIVSVNNTLKAIWAYAALSCGFPGSEVLSLLDTVPSGIPELYLCEKADADPERLAALKQTVSALFADNPRRWYAMKLRARVGFEDVEARIKSLDEKTPLPEFFYPYEEIVKRVGKKLIRDNKPVIRDIVFFKLRVTDILPLFCKIGDMAWCYTTSGRPGGDYAPIPSGEFARFQETIGHFTPDYEIAPIGGFEPEEGERVVILNGLMTNREFEVEKISDTGNVIFQLNMIGDNGFQWRTKANSHQIHKSPIN